jgi:hypothetical protein
MKYNIIKIKEIEILFYFCRAKLLINYIYIKKFRLDNKLLFKIITLLVINFQVDEYIETTISPLFQHNLQSVRDIITFLDITNSTERLCHER